MKFKHLPLRAKLTLWSALIVGLTLLLASAGTALFLHEEQIENVDRALQQDARHFFHQYREHGSKTDWITKEELDEVLPTNSRPSRFIEITGRDGFVYFRSDNLGDRFRDAPAKLHIRQVGSRKVRVGTYSEAGLTIRLGHDLEAVQDLTRELLRGYAVGLPLVLVGVALGGWWLARQALAPIREIADAAEQITALRLDQRLAVPPVRDEIGRLAAVLNAMFDRLDTSFRHAMRFSADASHELKTPLTILRSGIEDLLRSPTLPAEDARPLAALLEQTRELASITESLLLLSRADAGRLVLDLRPADVCEIVADCVEDARIMAEGRGLEFDTEFPAQAFAAVDRGRLTQILLNLLDNAVKYNRAAGRVRVSVEAGEKRVVVTVANTGPGIPPAHAARIFERFHRADPSAEIPGHGLGLALACELARAHRGELTLTRADSEWTEFQLQISAVLSAASFRRCSPTGILPAASSTRAAGR